MKAILFKNGQIFPHSAAAPFNWLVSVKGRITAMGTSTQKPPELNFDRIVDLQNKTVIPAFGDAHLHSLWAAKALMEIDLLPAQSLQQALTILIKQKHRFSEGQWIIGRGFNKNFWVDGQPHQKYLNEIFPDNPVYLESQDCHSAWVNDLAFKMCGINDKIKDPAGGKFERDSKGHLSGLVFDRAMEMFKARLPEMTEVQLLPALNQFVEQLLQNGITTIHTMEGLEAFTLWQKYMEQFGRKMRVVFYIPQEELETLIKNKMRSGSGDQWLKIGGVKFFSDGSLGSQTAAVRQPYENQPNNYGLLLFSEKELRERVKLAESNALATAIHAIGDRAVEMVLQVLKATEVWRRRHQLVSRIEHAQLVPRDLLPLFKQHGLVASMQPIHIADDAKTAQTYWAERSRFAFPFRSLAGANVPLAFGSDAPVAEPNPIKGIYQAVCRKFRFDLNAPCWIEQETISVKQAVQAFTRGVALAANSLADQGELLPGKIADFVVLNQNIFESDSRAILKTKIEKTILGGQPVFSCC